MSNDKAHDTRMKASENMEAFNRAYTGRHERFCREADRHNRFYMGDQWDPEVRAKLEAEGRPVLTINEILRTVNAVLGNHSESRVDIRLRPRQDGHAETAEVLTSVFDYVLEHTGYQDEESQVFSDGVIMDAGYFDVRMDFEESVQGEVTINSVDPFDVVIDPDAKEYDPSTWSEVFITRWHTLNEIETIYGKEKRKEVEGLLVAGETAGQNSVRFKEDVRFGENETSVPTGVDAVKNVRGIRVVERQWRKLAPRKMFVDLETGDMRPVPDNWEEDRVQEVAERFGLGVTTKVKPRIRWTVSADHVLLHDEWSLYDDFTVVPFFPFFRRGRFGGLVRQLISPQEQLNKIESQILHVVNTTANSGYLVEEGSLANMTPEELEKRGAETGVVVTYRRNRQPPAKIQPNQVPSGLDRIGQKSSQFIYDISGSEALLGKPPKSQVSGVAMDQTMNRALVTLQPVMDNLAKTRRMVAKRVLALVQKFYNETRVMRVTDWRDPQEPEKEVTINEPDLLGNILNDVTTGHYDVMVGTAPMRNGALEHEFAEALQLREAGVAIPDDVIIRSSHLNNKHDVAERVMKLQGMGEPTDEEAQMLQMQQEMAMQQMQLQLQELEAKAQKLMAEAQLHTAKAENLQGETQLRPDEAQAKLSLQLERLRFEIDKAKADMETKLQLADKHTEARNAGTVMTTMAKRLDTERKLETQERIAQMGAPREPERKR